MIYFLYIIDWEGSMRTLVDIPDEDLKLLKVVTKRLAISRAEFVRQAIAAHLAPHRRKMDHSAFGLWKQEEDGLAYQERMRSEW